MNKRLFVFDLDGTLADTTHRQPLIERPACPHCGWVKDCDHHRDGTRPEFTPDWDAFYAACVNDTLITPVWHLLTTLSSNPLNEIAIVTGRSAVVAEETSNWLRQHQVFHDSIHMRSVNDRRTDVELKETWLKSLSDRDRARIICAFEDRSRVTDMWRRNGVFCLQVDRGDF